MNKKEFKFLVLLNTINNNVIDDASLIWHKLTVENYFGNVNYITIERGVIALDQKLIYGLTCTLIYDDYHCYIDFISLKEYEKYQQLKKYIDSRYNNSITIIKNIRRIESVKCELRKLFRKNIPHKYLVKYISVGDDYNE